MSSRISPIGVIVGRDDDATLNLLIEFVRAVIYCENYLSRLKTDLAVLFFKD